MAVSSLLVLAVIVVGVILLVRYLGRTTRGGHDSAERVLSERYARGDIDEEEYRRRRDVLRGGPAA